MTETQLASLIRRKTKTSVTTYSNADLLVDVNVMKDEIAGQIADMREDAFQVTQKQNTKVATSLPADRLYAFDAEVMNNLVGVWYIKDTTSGTDPIKLKEVKIQQSGISMEDETVITDKYANVSGEAGYMVVRKNIFLLSGAVVVVTNGLIVIFKSFPADLTDMTASNVLHTQASATAPGFPREFNELWARRVSIEYKDTNRMKLSSREAKYEVDLQEKLQDYKTASLDHQIIGTLPTALERGDDSGFNY